MHDFRNHPIGLRYDVGRLRRARNLFLAPRGFINHIYASADRDGQSDYNDRTWNSARRE